MTRARLSVLFLESSRNFGGQERRLLHEAALLVARGYTVTIATTLEGILFQRARLAGFRTYSVRMLNSGDILSLYNLCRIIKDRAVNVIYTHSGKDSWLGGMSGMLMSVPVVRSRELLTRIKHKSAFNFLATRILACSQSVKEHLLASGIKPSKVFVQYPPVDVKKIQGVTLANVNLLKKELSLTQSFPIIICIGQFRGEKRQQDVVFAMETIIKKFPQAKLLLAGSGRFVDHVKGVAADLGLAKVVQFLGEREDIPDLLACTDILVCPSATEPFGMVAVEGLAAGVAVVASQVGGFREIITGGVNGLHVPPRSPGAIAQAVERILCEPGLREQLVRAGRKRALDFDAPRAIVSLTGHFRAVVKYR